MGRLPDHGHATIYPSSPLTLSRVFQAVKVSSMIAINVRRRETGDPFAALRAGLWLGRFPSLRSRASFDRALRTVKECHETVEYFHLNPVRRGLAERAQDWRWSSVHEYAGMGADEQERRCGLLIDPVPLPADEKTRI